MICKKCGLETFDNSVNCINCGAKISKSSGVNESNEELFHSKVDFVENREESVKKSVAKTDTVATTVTNNKDSSEIKTHMVKAVIGLLIAPSPLSIIAVLYAVSTSSKIKAGDLDAAKKSSHTTNILTNVVFALFAVGVISFIIMGLMG